MGFPRQEYWSGLPFPFLRDLSNPEVKPPSGVSCIGMWIIITSATWEAHPSNLAWTQLSVSFSSVQFSHSVVSDSLWSRGPQHARLPCPSTTPGVYSNSCPLSQWCHPTISFSVSPFSSCLQSLPASESFQMSQLFPSRGQSIGVSTSVLPVNILDWFSLGWTGWISLLSKGLPRVFSNTTVQKHQFFGTQLSL